MQDPEQDEIFRKKMDKLFEAKKNLRGSSISDKIEQGREYRNPRIVEKLIENLKIKQYGSNFEMRDSK